VKLLQIERGFHHCSGGTRGRDSRPYILSGDPSTIMTLLVVAT
jgi:hypothetical protein